MGYSFAELETVVFARLADEFDTDEPLHPDLRPYLREDGFLHHPLVVSLVVIPSIENKVYASKLKRLQERPDDYRRNIYFYERPYRWLTLMEWWEDGLLDEDTLREMLPAVYMDAEFTHQNDTEQAIRAFRDAGYTTDDTHWASKPTRPLMVYRGGSPEGMSWTTSLLTAKWFAQRFGGDESVYVGYAPPDAILAMMGGRGENEVVVDPSLLCDVHEWVDGEAVPLCGEVRIPQG